MRMFFVGRTEQAWAGLGYVSVFITKWWTWHYWRNTSYTQCL